ncbi:MAG TPA: hypothetical protein VK992_07400 [Candidatus Caenarcaniphilales bacterium]|nr:hypothetical protein [Candidatus Caenarcaniphilales bacterium]
MNERLGEALRIISVAVDVQGAEAARPWLERAGATFLTVVDAGNDLGRALGYKVVPTGILVDEHGIVRHLQAGGFEVDDEETLGLVEAFARGEVDEVAEAQQGREDVAERLRIAHELLRHGKREEALVELDRALELDPDDFVVRKQRWAIRNPDRFYPAVDRDWQREQLVRERPPAD